MAELRLGDLLADLQQGDKGRIKKFLQNTPSTLNIPNIEIGQFIYYPSTSPFVYANVT